VREITAVAAARVYQRVARPGAARGITGPAMSSRVRCPGQTAVFLARCQSIIAHINLRSIGDCSDCLIRSLLHTLAYESVERKGIKAFGNNIMKYKHFNILHNRTSLVN